MYIRLSADEHILTDTFAKLKKKINGWMDRGAVASCHAMQSCTRLSLFVNEEAENMGSLVTLPFIYQSALHQHILIF